MGRVKLCYVKGCLNAQTNGRRSTFFNFPLKSKRNQSQCQQWISFTQNNSINLEAKRPFGYICDLHFKNEDFLDESRQKLHCRAIPSLLPPLTTASTSETSEESLDCVEWEQNSQEKPKINVTCSQDENLEKKQEYLVCLIEAYPILYNPLDPDYGDEVKVAETWVIISDVVDLPVEECQTEWNALLSKYKKQRQVILQHEKKGIKAKSKWPLYDTFNFIEKLLNSHAGTPTTNDGVHNIWVQNELDNVKLNNTSSYNNGLEINTEPPLNTTTNSDENYRITKIASLRQYQNMSQSTMNKFSEDNDPTKPVIAEDVHFVNSLLLVLIRMKRKKKTLCKAELMATVSKYRSNDET